MIHVIDIFCHICILDVHVSGVGLKNIKKRKSIMISCETPDVMDDVVYIPLIVQRLLDAWELCYVVEYEHTTPASFFLEGVSHEIAADERLNLH
jgi:hypothetical protein